MTAQNISSVPALFDTLQHRRNRERAAATRSCSFLADWCLDALRDRLDVVRRSFPSCLQLGALTSIEKVRSFMEQSGTEHLTMLDPAFIPLKNASQTALQAEIDRLPFAPQSFDMVFSPFLLHAVNDLPGALIQIRRILKSDGLFIAAMAGGETLYELKTCLMEAELRFRGGASPRILPFAGKKDMGALMQRAGFALPVVDSEKITVTHENVFRLMADLRGMGEGNIVSSRDKKPVPKEVFTETARLYAERHQGSDGRIEATFEIVFLLGWAPHPSQQQPLRPGQGRTSLADVLK